MNLLALIGSLGVSAGLIGAGIALRRVRRPRTWSAVPGGERRDFFGDRAEELARQDRRAA